MVGMILTAEKIRVHFWITYLQSGMIAQPINADKKDVLLQKLFLGLIQSQKAVTGSKSGDSDVTAGDIRIKADVPAINVINFYTIISTKFYI